MTIAENILIAIPSSWVLARDTPILDAVSEVANFPIAGVSRRVGVSSQPKILLVGIQHSHESMTKVEPALTGSIFKLGCGWSGTLLH